MFTLIPWRSGIYVFDLLTILSLFLVVDDVVVTEPISFFLILLLSFNSLIHIGISRYILKELYVMLRASASVLQLTNIYDENDDKDSSQRPYAFFLELDDVHILLDCGWDENFSVRYLEKLLPYAKKADAVLLSSPHLNACGALPFVIQQLKPSACVFAAGSTSKIGLHGVLHPFLYNFPNSRTFVLEEYGEFQLTVDSIYSTFRSVREPFGRKVVIPAKNSPVECYTHFASRMLGGYAWSIKYQIDELFYCPDYSMKSSYSLKNFTIPTTPNILLIESFSCERKETTSTDKFEDQLQQLFKEMQHTLRSGSDVLIPIDVAGRGIEVVNIIVHLLQEKGGDKYKVVLAAVQAQEIIGKAVTMTEAFRDDVILSENGLFSTLTVCKNAAEVMQVGGPKVCLADGASLDCGVAGELLVHFLSKNREGGENLIVFTERPGRHTNAYRVFHSAPMEVMTYSVTRRCPLNEEEREEYYIRIEKEVEEQRKERAKALITVEEDQIEDEDEEGVDDIAENDKGGAPSGASNSSRKIVGLYTTHGFQDSKAKFLQFGVIAPPKSINSYQGMVYGIPMNEEEELMMKKLGSTKIISDAGPEDLLLTNDAQREANLPCKVFVETFSFPRECKIAMCDLSGHPETANSVKSLIKSKFAFSKKIVCLRGNFDSFQSLLKFCKSEKSIKCGENVFWAQGDIPVKLDTPISSYTVTLDSGLEQQLPKMLKRVREHNSSGDWEVGWVDGCLTTRMRKIESTASRGVTEDHLLLHSVPDDRIEGCATHREHEDVARGSFFVGNVELNRIKEATRKNFTSEFYQKAPLLVYDDGVCVRRSSDGTITIASLPTSSFFEVRRTIYDQFHQVL